MVHVHPDLLRVADVTEAAVRVLLDVGLAGLVDRAGNPCGRDDHVHLAPRDVDVDRGSGSCLDP